MKPRDILLPAVVLFVGLLIGLYLLGPSVSPLLLTNSPPLVIALIYYLGTPILTVAGVSFGLSWYRGRVREDRHRQEILQVLKMPVSSKGEVEYTPNLSGDMIRERALSWAESNPLYPQTLAHLKNYSDTLALLEEARQNSDKQRTAIIQKIRAIEKLIDQKFASFTSLPVSDTPPEKPKPHYVKQLVRYAVIMDAISQQAENALAELRVEKLQVGKRTTNQLLWRSYVLAVGSKVALKKLMKRVQTLPADPKMKRATRELQRLEELLKTNPALRDFEAKKNQIAFALSAGRHALPGHCDRCP